MEHIPAFIIHILAALFIYAIVGNNRFIIFYGFSYACVICISCIFTEDIVDKQSLTVICKAFVNPHVRYIFTRNAISKPFMTAFMYYYKIPFHSPACS